MLEHLFGSKTRLKLLRTLFRNPEKPYYVRELSRSLESQINAVRRELALLEKAGLVKELSEGKKDFEEKSSAGAKLRKYYALDTESILYPELNALLVKGQAMGEQAFLEDIKSKSGKLDLMLLTGSFTGDRNAPSDMLLVGEVKPQTVAKLIKGYEKEFGFEIRYTIMDLQEFFDRRHVMDKFLYSLFEASHIKVLDKIKQN